MTLASRKRGSAFAIRRFVRKGTTARHRRLEGYLAKKQAQKRDSAKRSRPAVNEIDASLTVSPVRDTAGAIIGASKIGVDITEQKKATSAQALRH